MALLGAFVGSLFAGPLADYIGRKPIVILSDICFTAGSIIMALSQSILILQLGRVIVGLGIGVGSMITPIYLAEVSPISIRGRTVSIYQAMISAGILIAAFTCLLCGRNWRLMLVMPAVPAMI